MIFSRFFSPSHSSNDPDTRIKAIEKLSPDSANERRILHELAFNDAVASVSLAALEKLNSFALWLKMSQIAKEPKLVNAAQAKVESALIDGSAAISRTEIKEYLLRSAPSEQVIKCLPLMTEMHDDTGFCLNVVSKIGRSSFTQQLLQTSPSNALKLAIVEQSQDSDLLQRVLRKCTNETLHDALQSRIADLSEAAQKPIALSRQLTLVLSKLLALTEKADYAVIQTTQQTLIAEYQALAATGDCLEADARDEFNAKFANINDRVNQLLARLRPDYEAQQHAIAHQAAKSASANAVAEVKRQHKQLQGEQILSLTLGEVTRFQQTVEQAELALSELQAFEPPADEIESMLESYRHIWDRLPELQRQVEGLHQQLNQWQALLDSQADEWQLDTLNADWRDLTADMAVVPTFLRDRWQSILAQFKQRHLERRSNQQRHLKHCRKHINIINNLVEQGKYRAAMARYQRLEADYGSLPAATQLLLEKRFDQTKEQIARLEGWQIYLAAPRKPELIEQAQALLDEQQTDMPARARSIKYLRQQWQSLGATGTPEDEALNTHFDDVLEKAFEPCRQYYAALEQQSNEAAQARQTLIESMQGLTANEIEQTERYQQFEALKKQWQQAGQTDSERYRELRENWDAACTHINDLLTPWIQQNRYAKQELINQVTALATLEDVQTAREEAKTLQLQWKALGTAGKRYESKLWFAFKAANDALFSKVKSVQAEQKAARSEEVTHWRNDLEAVRALLAQGEFDQAQTSIAACSQALNGISDNKAQRALRRELDEVQTALNSALQAQFADELLRAAETLCDTIFSGSDAPETLAERFNVLPNRWFKGQALSTPEDALKQLICLEVLGLLESPEQDASLRSTIQLQMMQSKLNGDPLPDVHKLIGDLLASAEVLVTQAATWQPRVKQVCACFALQDNE